VLESIVPGELISSYIQLGVRHKYRLMKMQFTREAKRISCHVMLSHVALLKVHDINPILNSEITAAGAVVDFLSISSLSEADMSMFLFSFSSCGSHGLIRAPRGCSYGQRRRLVRTKRCTGGHIVPQRRGRYKNGR
jgi:hypothetical protein